MRMLIDQTFGTHFHAFYGDSELVIGLNPLRVIQARLRRGCGSGRWIGWGITKAGRSLRGQSILNVATPIFRQAAGHLVFADGS